MAVTATHVYWTNYTTGPRIGRANLDGTGIDAALIPLTGLLFYLDTDDTHVYWANSGTNTVGRANLDGTGADNAFITGANGPFAVAAASWTPAAALTGDGAFGQTATGATSDARTLTLTSTGDGPLAVGAAAISGADAGRFRITADACSGATLAAGATCTVAVSFAPTAAGAAAATLTIPSDASGSPAALALSGVGVAATTPTPAPGPSAPTGPAPAAAALQSRTAPARASLRVTVPSAGTLVVRARAAVGGRTIALPTTAIPVAAAGAVKAVLTLPARVRARLAQRGRLGISVTLAFTASGGATTTLATTAALRAPRSRVLRGQWIGRTLGPWKRVPHLTGARRGALDLGRRGRAYVARVVR